jgi:hypothetical protein
VTWRLISVRVQGQDKNALIVWTTKGGTSLALIQNTEDNHFMTKPEIITNAAKAAGVTEDQIEAAIRATLALITDRMNPAERIEIYETWLDPIARPLSESTGLALGTVQRALVAAVQWTPAK